MTAPLPLQIPACWCCEKPGPCDCAALIAAERAACAAARHPADLYDPREGVTWCECGQVSRPGEAA